MNHQNQLQQMANGAMFATISPFLVICDNTSKANINLQKLTKLEPLTLVWMLTIIRTPPRLSSLNNGETTTLEVESTVRWQAA
jgi:hypothetical protein